MELNTRDVVGIGLFSFVIGFGFGKVIGDKALAAKQKELDDYKHDVNLNRQFEETLRRSQQQTHNQQNNSSNDTIYGSNDHLF